MSDHDGHSTRRPGPSDKVRALERLVGRWTIAGGATGFVTYEWMPGGFFFLRQHVELGHAGDQETGSK